MAFLDQWSVVGLFVGGVLVGFLLGVVVSWASGLAWGRR